MNYQAVQLVSHRTPEIAVRAGICRLKGEGVKCFVFNWRVVKFNGSTSFRKHKRRHSFPRENTLVHTIVLCTKQK